MADKLVQIVAQLRPELQAALITAFDDIRDGVDYPALELAIERGDVAGAIDALNLDEGSFAPYVLIATTIFMRYGAAFAPKLGVRFTGDISPDIAVAVGRMTQETRDAIQDVVASRLGRRETAKRIRPLIGLSRAQVSYVESMRERLLSGGPDEMRAVLSGQTLRDKRYDRMIKRAIVEARRSQREVAAGRPAITPRDALSEKKVDEITEAYARKLKAKRAADIAQIEVDQYAEAAKYQSALKVAGPVKKTWHHSSIYINARPDHVGMSGRSVALDESFIMPDGVPMRYAHDPRGGARHNASCRCRTSYEIEKVA